MIGVVEQHHATGRRVGMITHIKDLKERIAVKIAVAPASNGSSSIQVQDGQSARGVTVIEERRKLRLEIRRRLAMGLAEIRV